MTLPSDKGFIEIDGAAVDVDRKRRCGFPEVIYGESKTAESILNIAIELCEHGLDVLATRVSPEKAKVVLSKISYYHPNAYYNEVARTLRVPLNVAKSEYRGRVAILTAGTSDLPVAEEARETAQWTGCDVTLIVDVGVAGPQRLQAHLEELQNQDVIVVVAGMEGALPSVVGGYVSVPIVAVPTSVGYGAAFGGLAAMLGMMNSCSSNVTVVNIDAGFKGGYVAGLLAKRVAESYEAGLRRGFSDGRDAAYEEMRKSGRR